MSIIGTTAAAGVAQTGLQAQQVARKRDQRANRKGDEVRRVREAFETHILAVEEGEKPADPTQLHVNTDLNDEPSARRDETLESPGHGDAVTLGKTDDDDAAAQSRDLLERLNVPRPDQPPAADKPDDGAPDDAKSTLYRHLDVLG